MALADKDNPAMVVTMVVAPMMAVMFFVVNRPCILPGHSSLRRIDGKLVFSQERRKAQGHHK